ncbi:MAG: hypothetical protein IT557_02000 [Alphaproteobacteria bacterium]|nr:hypothetical protein [Alphaproteobacteria bacterium]
MRIAAALLRRLETLSLASALFAVALGYLMHLELMGYQGQGMLWPSVAAMLTIDNPDYASGRLAVVFPPLAFYGSLLVDLLPLGRPVPSGVVLAAVVAGMLVASWYRALRLAGYSVAEACLVVALMAVQPPFLWAIAEAPAAILSVASMYGCGRAAFQLRVGASVVSKTRLALLLPVLAFTDVAGMVVAFSLVLVLAGFVQQRDLLRSVRGTYVILVFPLVFVMGAFIWGNWLFLSDGLAWTREVASRFVGPEGQIVISPWLREYMGDLSRCILPWLFMLVIACPVLFLGTAALWERAVMVEGQVARVGPALFSLVLAIAFAVPMATMFGLVSHPYAYLALGCGLAPLVALTWPAGPLRSAAVASALLFGMMGSSLCASLWAPPDLLRWRTAMFGTPVPRQIETSAALARFLADKDGVMIDERTAARAILLRGTGVGLDLTSHPRFAISITTGHLASPYVAVPNASHDENALDRVRRRFGTLFDRGASGYSLVYDQLGWRVYARLQPEEQPPAGIAAARDAGRPVLVR